MSERARNGLRKQIFSEGRQRLKSVALHAHREPDDLVNFTRELGRDEVVGPARRGHELQRMPPASQMARHHHGPHGVAHSFAVEAVEDSHSSLLYFLLSTRYLHPNVPTSPSHPKRPVAMAPPRA